MGRTVVPLPTFKSIDIITVNDDSGDFIFVDLINGPTGLSGESMLGISDNKIDFARDSFLSEDENNP